MLTADLVRARVKDGQLSLVQLAAPSRKEAVALADGYLEVARAMVGEPREAVLEALAGIEVRMRLEKVAEGLKKLLFDHCEVEAEAEVDPVALREEVFSLATERRRDAETMESFDRARVLSEVATGRSLAPDELERLLFSDLRAAHRLLRVPEFDGERLVRMHELGQEQAVLLRAERVVVEVRCRTPSAYRALFRRMKFLRLLCTVDAMPSGGYRLTIDGPYSLFAATTKYGLELASLLPLLREAEHFALDAVVQWGKERERVSFALRGGDGARAEVAPPLPEELRSLMASFTEKYPEWSVEPSDALVELRGECVLVPDLAFTHRTSGEVVLLELLGHWSRQAVWRRVELAAALPTPMIFAFSSRLRVSEEVLPEELPACLYAFKGALRAAAVHERLQALVGTGEDHVAPRPR